MCGIAGYVDLAGAPPDTDCVREMTRLLTHRGPDSGAVLVAADGRSGPSVVLGHRRLAVIDLSEAANQPLAGEDGTILVDFNGEIYDFATLRVDLETRGHTFASRSDTEVIVHAYEEFGDEFVSRLQGMFAIALWDGRRRRLVLVRDRAGKKPLYYAWNGRQLTFASEIKALRACPWVDDGVAWERTPELLAFGYVPWPDTLHRGIHQVPPASVMVLENGTLSEPHAYWHLRYAEHGESSNLGWPEAKRRVTTLLTEAVRRRLVSDVPIGVLLSGGLDSSGLVALMAGLGVRARTFTIGMEGERSYDERRFASLVADRFETEHTEITVRADAAQLLERIVWFLDQPLADSSALPTYLVAQAAREHVTVALSGDGADELFAGYERFGAALLANDLPMWIQRSIGGMSNVLPRTPGYFNARRRIERFAAGLGGPAEERYRSWVSVFGVDLLPEILSSDLRALLQVADPSVSFAETLREAGEPGRMPLLHRLLYTNFRTYLHDDLLVKMDRMSMANSLEVRSPYLDTALIEEIASMAPSMKATPFGLKRLLRRTLADMLPREIVHRPKHGFGVPVGRWFRRELREPFVDMVLAPDARSAAALDRSAVRGIFARHLEGRADHGQRLWAILAFEVWLRMLERPLGESASVGQLSSQCRERAWTDPASAEAR